LPASGIPHEAPLQRSVVDCLRRRPASLLEPLEGNWENQIAYLGNNEYLMAQEIDLGWDEATETSRDEQHLFVLNTDGQGQLTQQAGPFVWPGPLSRPRFEPLDDDHVLLLWREGRGVSQPDGNWQWVEELATRVLYKHH
jgi:hypothetical protein